ncbi:hypothetical protein CHELA1G2_12177 [Hyphomicrobiales bacterium]|nr:hypothetical protein CHELA1G2_12177 [Hyphomicrobiales bacterium]
MPRKRADATAGVPIMTLYENGRDEPGHETVSRLDIRLKD